MSLSLKAILDGYNLPENQYRIYVADYGMVESVSVDKAGDHWLKIPVLADASEFNIRCKLDNAVLTAGVITLPIKHSDAVYTLLVYKFLRVTTLK